MAADSQREAKKQLSALGTQHSALTQAIGIWQLAFGSATSIARK
jgi:hypothetical protein